MSVAEDKQIYKCFSCGEAGNVFKFIQEYENISFLEAVKKCADIAGIEFSYGKKKTVNKYQDLYDIYSFASKLYQNNLFSVKGKEAREYLKKASKEKRVINVSYDLPKSFVVSAEDEYRVYISVLSSATISSRAKNRLRRFE